jgi:elongation factor G
VWVPAVEKGVRDALDSGIDAGYPIVDVEVVLTGGSFSETDSNEMAFAIAASMAFKDGCKQAGPALLEPVVSLEVVTPEDFMGNVVGNLNSRRGRILGMTQRAGAQIINASAPLAEMFGYATSLRSMSQGRASYSMQFSSYEQVPAQISSEIIARIQGGV